NPTTDPHGDPIPDAHGKMGKPRIQTSLHKARAKRLEVVAVSDRSTALLEFLNAKGIRLGTQLDVIERYEFDNSIELKIKNQPAFTISEQVSKSIMVKPI
ncbi:MAG TPA: FeoA family protein, partial [Chitinophaga sp.]|nr:FeoA family protein [Chitinophaga sp.]